MLPQPTLAALQLTQADFVLFATSLICFSPTITVSTASSSLLSLILLLLLVSIMAWGEGEEICFLTFPFRHICIIEHFYLWCASSHNFRSKEASWGKLVDSLPSSLTRLDMWEASSFNQSLDSLPPSLINLSSGSTFNHPIDSLPPSLTHLSFHVGSKFDQKVNSLPSFLTSLIFGTTFNQNVDSLPSSITFLSFGSSFNQSVKDARGRRKRDGTMKGFGSRPFFDL